jgi:hypothetical protein
METSRALMAGGAAIALAAVVWMVTRPPSKPTPPTTAPADHPDDDTNSDRDPDTADDHGGYTGPQQDAARGTDPSMPKLDRHHADEMRARILALLVEAGPGRIALSSDASDGAAVRTAGAFPEMPGADSGPGNQAQGPQGKYIQSIVRNDFFPLARQCYGNAQAVNPELKGTVELHFRIVGDKRVGGVVDQAFVGDGGDIHDQEFSECMTQSMMSVSFDAPPGDKEVTVTYPIVFSPDEPGSGS